MKERIKRVVLFVLTKFNDITNRVVVLIWNNKEVALLLYVILCLVIVSSDMQNRFDKLDNSIENIKN